MMILMTQGGTSSIAVAQAAQTSVAIARARWGRRYCKTRRSAFTAGSAGQGSNDLRRFFFPILRELVQLSEGGQIGHAIKKDFADQVVEFVMNTELVQLRRLEI